MQKHTQTVVNTYINRGGNFGTNIDTSASCVAKSQLPPRPYLPSSASNSDGMMRENFKFSFLLCQNNEMKTNKISAINLKSKNRQEIKVNNRKII